MLTAGVHWLSALAIALGIHVLGLLWFDPVESTLPKPNVFSDEIVVMLGPGSGSSTESARLLETPDSIPKLEISKHAETEPLTSAVEKNVKSNDVEETVAPSLARRSVALATVQPSKSPDADVVEHKPESRGVGVSEIGEAVPSLKISGAETAETVPTVTAAAEPDAADIPPLTVVVAQTDDADQSPPAIVNIESQDAEVTTVVSPTQLVREASDVEASDVVEVEDSTYSVAAEAVNTDPQVEKAGVEVPDPAVAPSQIPATDAARVDTAAAPQPDVFESEQPVAVEVEQGIQHGRLAAVVLDFETVEATTVVSSQVPAPQVTQPVSIEQQIARALNADDLQDHEGYGIAVVARFAGQLKGRLEESMHYPRAARLAGQEGKVVVRFVIDRNGRVLSIVLEKASGHAILDREAVEMIERGEPFPIMPTEMGDEVLELRVPIAYKIKEGTRNKDIPPIFLE